MVYTDEKIIAAVIASKTNREAIELLGMTERHFYHRMQSEALQAKLRAAREKVVIGALHKMQLGMSEAADVLRDIMNDVTVNPQTRVTAANSLLQNSMRLKEQLDLLPRIEALERGQT